MLDKKCLKFIFIECLASELNELVADVGKDCCLGMDFLILATFCDYASFDVAEESVKISKDLWGTYTID